MKERPIVFSGPMVRALLDGRKAQTRRLIRDIEEVPADLSLYIDCDGWLSALRPKGFNGWLYITDIYGRKIRCPHGATGDRLWLREAWALEDLGDDGQRVVWRADRAAMWVADGEKPHYLESDYKPDRWRSPLFMPRWASRITLEVTGVRVQRLQSISEEDARAEGLKVTGPTVNAAGEVIDARPGYLGYGSLWYDPRRAFEAIWNSTNGKRAPWSSNPWVWVVEFKVSKPATVATAALTSAGAT